MGTRQEPTVLRLVVGCLVGGAVAAVFYRVLGSEPNWGEAIASAAALATIMGALGGWDLYRRRARRPQPRVAAALIVAGSVTQAAIALAAGHGALVAAVVTAIFIVVSLLFVAWDFRPSARRPAPGA